MPFPIFLYSIDWEIEMGAEINSQKIVTCDLCFNSQVNVSRESISLKFYQLMSQNSDDNKKRLFYYLRI